ncbi:MAG TPA: hypothetical protein VLW85_02850 [Myxococcales bacterium]|nr:hypothetical protein [Myxococcales bacterium]
MKNFVVVGALALSVACGGGKNVRATGDVTTPEWVQLGTGAFTLEAGKQMHGVGSATGPDAKTRRQNADAAAQQQMAGGVTALAGSFTKMSEQTGDSVGNAIADICNKAATQAAAIRDHWVTPDGTEQALDVLDLQAFKAALQNVDGDDKLKHEMTANAEKAFDSLMRQ